MRCVTFSRPCNTITIWYETKQCSGVRNCGKGTRLLGRDAESLVSLRIHVLEVHGPHDPENKKINPFEKSETTHPMTRRHVP
jgi:hypothetical protein